MKKISATVKVNSCNTKKNSAATFAPCFLQHSSISIGGILEHPKTTIATSSKTN